MRATHHPTGRYRIYPSFLRFWNVLSHDNWRRTSTPTATICILSDLPDSVDRGDTAALVLLDLTAAFDTVNHEILFKCLQVTFGVDSIALPGFHPTWPVTNNRSTVGARSRPLRTLTVVCCKDQSSDLSILSSTQLTWLRSSLTLDCCCTSMPTTARFVALVCLPPSPVCRPTFLKQLITYPAGCDPIVYSLTPRKQK